MTDEETKQETQKEEEGEKKPLSLVEEAQKVRDEIRAENDRREKLLEQEQKLRAEQMLGGTTGGRVEPEVKEETATEYAKRVMSGGLNKHGEE